MGVRLGFLSRGTNHTHASAAHCPAASRTPRPSCPCGWTRCTSSPRRSDSACALGADKSQRVVNVSPPSPLNQAAHDPGPLARGAQRMGEPMRPRGPGRRQRLALACPMSSGVAHPPGPTDGDTADGAKHAGAGAANPRHASSLISPSAMYCVHYMYAEGREFLCLVACHEPCSSRMILGSTDHSG